MKIAYVSDLQIKFDNGDSITFNHMQDCCEDNFADFNQLDDVAKATEFDAPIVFEDCEYGFRFGNVGKMFFVPCYSEQNGYYTYKLDIYYNGEKVLNIDCELRL